MVPKRTSEALIDKAEQNGKRPKSEEVRHGYNTPIMPLNRAQCALRFEFILRPGRKPAVFSAASVLLQPAHALPPLQTIPKGLELPSGWTECPAMGFSMQMLHVVPTKVCT